MGYFQGKNPVKILALPGVLMLVIYFTKLHIDRKLQLRQLVAVPVTSGSIAKPEVSWPKVSFGEEKANMSYKETKDQSHPIPKLPGWMGKGKLGSGIQSGSPRYHIGVMTSQRYLETRSKDVYYTWGKEAASMALYFGEIAKDISSYSDLPIIQLSGVNDTKYPAQDKSFGIMQYWCDHLLDKYDWFVKVDDDTYVKVAFLENFLYGLDETVKFYIGRIGWGFPKELPILGLHGNSFCSGATVIYSKALLEAVCPHWKTCLSEMVSIHEDTEIGRCMISKMGLQCSVSANKIVDKLFFHTYTKNFYKGNLNTKPQYKDAVTLHAVKSSEDMYNIHFYYRQTMLNNIKTSVRKSNPYSLKPSKAKVKQDMCKKVKCTVPVNS